MPALEIFRWLLSHIPLKINDIRCTDSGAGFCGITYNDEVGHDTTLQFIVNIAVCIDSVGS